MADHTLRVLVVDDEPVMRLVLRNRLRQLGFADVDEATDGHDALAKLRADSFGLVLSDWNMQPMNGIELLRSVRSDPQLKGLPFILATGEGRDAHVAAARAAGVSGYLLKPVEVEALRLELVNVLGSL